MTIPKDIDQLANAIEMELIDFEDNHYWQALDGCLDLTCPKLDNSTLKHVIMKVEVVDRLYRANLIQFLKRTPEITGDKRLHYATEIAEQIVALDLDRRFEDLEEKAAFLVRDCLDDVVQIHHDMIIAIESVTNRSANVFTAKYLHFCRPDHFPILDNLAYQAVKTLMKQGDKKMIQKRFGYDESNDWYDWHCRGVLAIQTALINASHQRYSLRQLDKYFFGMGQSENTT